MHKTIAKALAAELRRRVPESLPGFDAVKPPENTWHSRTQPLYVQKYSERVWLFVSLAPVANREILWATLAWSDQARIPPDVEYYDDDAHPGENVIHLLDARVTGIAVDSLDEMGFALPVPPLDTRTAAVDLLYAGERWQKTTQENYLRQTQKGYQGRFEDFLKKNRKDTLAVIKDWSEIACIRPLSDDELAAIAADTVARCLAILENNGLPYLHKIAKTQIPDAASRHDDGRR